MSYIGNQPTSVSFPTDTFSGTGSQTAFTLQLAPASTNSVIVAVSGVVQDPSTYSVSGTTLTFSAAPPSGTGNISVRYLGIPASNITTTAYRTVTEFTATAGQTTFTPSSYTVGFINVYRNGVMLGSTDFTATNGTTVVLATGANVGDLIVTESFFVSSVLNAIPAVSGAVNSSYLASGLTASINTLNTTSGVLATQNGMTGIAKAWARFNGGSGNTAGTIIASFNVSSITVNGTGDFTINFSTAMPDANYSLVGTAKKATGQSTQSTPEIIQGYYNQSYTTTTARINCIASGSGPDTCETVSIAVLGN